MTPDRTDRVWRGIVAGFDESDSGRCAMRWAAAQASWHGCPLYAVRVLEPAAPVMCGWAPPMLPYPNDGHRSAAEDQLLCEVETCADEFPGLDAHGSLHDGRPGDRLADYADQVAADVIVVGGSERGWLARLLLGSTVDDLVRVAGRPVVVVRDLTPVQQANLFIGQSPVVAGIEDLPSGGPVLDFAFAAAGRGRSGLTVVVPASAGLEMHLDRWRRRHPDVPVTVEATDDPPRTMLGLSESAQLLVVGDDPRGPVRRVLGGTGGGRAVTHRAACSVAVVGSDGPERAKPASAPKRPWAER